ncbi:ECF transporter S component [Inediibacterium massiliense]|uniref:ECF transporter S component n=1 Tax=Inediibacterium massiliense TaxID=1658111 RepID=UPI0006B5C3D3|nr:ECF transporter S component [Inediibacterium massiliense]
MNHKKSKEIIVSGLFIAIGVLLPMAFHAFGSMGKILLPMHIPVFIGGFFLSPIFAFIVGAVTPIMSGVLTGMPVLFPMAVIMAFELGTYGLIISLFSRKRRKPVMIPLLVSMIGGRIVAGITVYFLSLLFGLKMNPILFVKGGILTGLPGIVVQMVLIPVVIYGLNRFIRQI